MRALPMAQGKDSQGGVGRASLVGTARSLSRDRRIFMEEVMNGIIYLVGLIVIIMAILSFLGLR